MLHKGTTDGPRHKDLGRGFFWLDTIRSIRIDSSLEIDTIFRYVTSTYRSTLHPIQRYARPRSANMYCSLNGGIRQVLIEHSIQLGSRGEYLP